MDQREDYKSTSGYVFMCAGGAITWRSSKQEVTAASTTEAEYIALYEGAKEASWLRSLYAELGHKQYAPTLIFCDNLGTLEVAKDPLNHRKMKHILVKYHWVRQAIKEAIIETQACSSTRQTADVMTKALVRIKHSQ